MSLEIICICAISARIYSFIMLLKFQFYTKQYSEAEKSMLHSTYLGIGFT